MARPHKPLTREDDGMTYLPIDRSRAAEKVYPPCDPRDAKAIGGIGFTAAGVMVSDDQMSRLDAALVGQACDNIVRGQETYASLLYLGRAQVDDLPALFEASQSEEIKVRWERLWVLCPYFSRLSRQSDGRDVILAHFSEDLGGVHLLSKFVEQNNPAVKRLFARVHDDLLKILLSKLHEFREDPRRGTLLSGIIATLETQEKVLRACVPPDMAEADVQYLLTLLYVRPPSHHSKRLSSTVLRERLRQWRR